MNTSRLILFSLCCLCLCGSVRALDPELTTPYKVKVVLRVAPNRLLTPIFKEHLRRDLQQQLQAALGAMGEVEVIDLADVPPEKQEPLWKEVAARGLAALRDGMSRDVSADKTHFVDVDYADGQYELHARQYDGLTGLASPTVRHERTPDRQFVARTAALLVDRDFGVVGTVADGGDGQAVRVAFKGGGLKVPLDRWVSKGDVFALVEDRGGGRTTRLPWTLLQADAPPGDDGACTCRVLSPSQRPLAAAGGGFRCLKLGTVRAPVRLRVIEARARGPAQVPDFVVVSISRSGFADTRATQLTPDSDGYCSTERESDPLYAGLAFVTVQQGRTVRAQVPLALVDDRTITVPIRLGPEPPRVVYQLRAWEKELLDEQGTLHDLFQDLNRDVGKSDSRAPALERARKALEGLDQQIKRSTEEQAELAKNKIAGKPLDLSRGGERLNDLQRGRKDLADFITRLEKILKEENSPEAQETKVALERARNLETAGDYDRAIELYEQVLARTKNDQLKARLDRLKEAWAPKSDEHAKAQAFIFDTWQKLKPQEVTKERVEEAQKALAVCKAVKDPLGPRKLLAAAVVHSQQVSKLLSELQPDVNQQDVKPAEELDKINSALGSLIGDATAYVKQTPAP